MEATTGQKAYGPSGSYEISGEPAVIINGVPEATPGDRTSIPIHVSGGKGFCPRTGFGKWFEGRDIRKLFEDQFYNGTVTNFDSATGWFHVVYEDGDSEDLDWFELQEVLLPLDINIPLKTLALRLAKKNLKSARGSEKNSACVKIRRRRRRMVKTTETHIVHETQVNGLNDCDMNGQH